MRPTNRKDIMKLNRYIAGVAVATLATLGVGLTAQSASAHTPTASATCEALTISATSYDGVKPGTKAVFGEKLVSEAVAYQPAVYGPKPLLTAAVIYQPATYELEYEFVHKDNGNGNSDRTKWAPQGWNAGENGRGWEPTGLTRNGKQLTAEVQAKDAVYGDAPLVSAEVLAQPAKYETVEVTPAVADDTAPNTIVATVDGTQVVSDEFGTSYNKVVPFADKTVAHQWSVTITAWNDPTGSKGWTKTLTGTTKPCAPVVTITEIPYPKLLANEVCGADNDTVYVDPEWLNQYGHLIAGPWIDSKYKTIDGKRVVDGSAQIKAEFRKTHIWAGTAGTSASDYTRWMMYPGTAPFVHEDIATACAPQPEDDVILGEWSKPVITCENVVGDEFAITREVSTTEYVLSENGWVPGEAVVTTEEGTYTVTAEDIEALDCVITQPPTTTPEPAVVKPAVTKAAAVTAEADTLATTGGSTDAGLLFSAGVLLLMGAALIGARRHARR